MPTAIPVPGQRWMSESEPELGLGIILKAKLNIVEVLFPAAQEMRQYAIKSAPLRRILFKEGDLIKTHAGEERVVLSLREEKDLVTYITKKGEVPEAGLSDAMSFSSPEERLLLGKTDDLIEYELRIKALQQACEWRGSSVRGFLGARVDLLPHQIFIVNEVSSRLAPRVLLADEVGLGKTIEACLILHRLHLTGRANRILIMVPDALTNQWFVELYRRFNLLFSIFDEERCRAIEANQENDNPFLDSQLILCNLDFLAENSKRRQQAVDAGWDLLVVDEAHHLQWSHTEVSAAYSLVDELAVKTPGVLLLSATPQQLGVEGHFARLRLLDPERYQSLESFQEETAHYLNVAKAADRILDQGIPTKSELKWLNRSENAVNLAKQLIAGNEEVRQDLINAILDSFGIGRVMFRNTRAGLTGFPKRQANLIAMKPGKDGFLTKVKWLAEWLKQHPQEKVLLICQSLELVEEIHEALLQQIQVATAVFHESMTLMQRDRQAAHFADEEEGAQILLCSEIGSEGRNFQFAHHLILFDLPDNPELLEQRIGRLDRIGQTQTIQIHVPYLVSSAEEVFARWYHEGLNAFEQHPHGALEIQQQLAESIEELIQAPQARKLTSLVKATQKLHAQVGKKLQQGHDRLLELSSCRVDQALEVIEKIEAYDDDALFEDFFLRMMDSLGIGVEELSHRTYLLSPGNKTTHALPGLAEEGMSVTFDRNRALTRETIGFMSADHPLVRGAMDTVLSRELGNSAFALWRHSGAEGLILECTYVVDCISPAHLHVDRFLPPVPISIIVDHLKEDLTGTFVIPNGRLQKSDVNKLLDRGVMKKKVIPEMIAKAKSLAEAQLVSLVEDAQAVMQQQLQAEITRLQELQRVNDHIKPDEIESLQKQQDALNQALAAAQIRLDSIRLIWRMA